MISDKLSYHDTQANMQMIEFLSGIISRLASGDVMAVDYKAVNELSSHSILFSPLGSDVSRRIRTYDGPITSTISLRLIKPVRG